MQVLFGNFFRLTVTNGTRNVIHMKTAKAAKHRRLQRMEAMLKEQARTEAAANRKAFMAADIAFMFGRGPRPCDEKFGHSNGWFSAGGYSFDAEELEPIGHHPRHPADQGLND